MQNKNALTQSRKQKISESRNSILPFVGLKGRQSGDFTRDSEGKIFSGILPKDF